MCRIVFREGQHGTSLVDLIDSPSAEEIYAGWLVGVRTETGLSIPGVGELTGQAFTSARDLDAALNPLGHTPLRLKPRRSKAPVFILLALLLGAAGYGTWWLQENGRWRMVGDRLQAILGENGRSEITKELRTVVSVERSVVVGGKQEDEAIETDTEPAAVAVEEQSGDLVRSEPKETIQHSAFSIEHSSPAVSHTVAGRTYVVVGVYSTEQNARRAAAEHPGTRLYYYGDKWMVSVFENDSRDEARSFIRGATHLPEGLWPYTKK